jgi:hypothetical protein
VFHSRLNFEAQLLRKWREDGKGYTYLKGWSVNIDQAHAVQPPYIFLFLFPISVSVVNWIEKLHKDFLCNGLDNESKIHLVKWKKVYSLLHRGDLGIRNLLTFNQPLLGSGYGGLLWREGLIGQMVDNKYGSLVGGWCSNVVTEPQRWMQGGTGMGQSPRPPCPFP